MVVAVNRDFNLLFTAAAISQLGTSVGYVAMPLVAVTALDATPAEVGLLATLSTVAFLVIGLPVGVWSDRVRRRGLLITADLARAALLCSVPVAWAFDALTITHLYLVVAASGVATVFFEVAKQSYLPAVVGREALVAANSRLVGMDAVNEIAGRAVAGYLVALVTAPLAILVDAVSFLVSAVFLGRVGHREPAPVRVRSAVWRDMGEGVRFVAGHPLLRAIVLSGGLANLGIVLTLTMLPVLVVDELGWSATMLGLFLAVGGVGSLCGALVARRLADRFGTARVLVVGSVLTIPCGFGMPFVGSAPWVAALGWLVLTARVAMNNVLTVSLRQQVTPDQLLGRMNATFRFVLMGTIAVAAFLAGVLGQAVAPAAALFAGAVAIALGWLPIVCSPLRKALPCNGFEVAQDQRRPSAPRTPA